MYIWTNINSKPMNKKELAIQEFKNGLNCAQAVLVSYCDELNLERPTALSVASGFGSGMGRMQLTCGAVTGAFMAIGVYNGRKFENNADQKAKSAEMIQSFSKAFVGQHKTINCRELLDFDISTPEGLQMAREKNLFGTVCVKCINDSIDILEELFN